MNKYHNHQLSAYVHYITLVVTHATGSTAYLLGHGIYILGAGHGGMGEGTPAHWHTTGHLPWHGEGSCRHPFLNTGRVLENRHAVTLHHTPPAT